MKLLGCALLALSVVTPRPAIAEEPGPAPLSFTASANAPVPERGDRGMTLTVLQGNDIQEVPLKFLGTYHDATGPGRDLYLVELLGPVAEKVGVAAGMSGSPVFLDGRLVGALSYRIGTLPRDAIGGVTPVGDMLDATRSAPQGTTGDSTAQPIRTPILGGGLVGPVRDWLAPQLEELGFVLVSGGSAGPDAIDDAAALRPGSPVGVALVRGDMSIAATGTVTWVDEDLVYAFGHPFLGSGRTEMPMLTAEVLHTVPDMIGSVKLAHVGAEVGAILDDRLTAIVGRVGAVARMIPVDLSVRGADYGEQTFHFELVQNSVFAPTLAGAVVANSLLGNTGYDREATMLTRGRIRFRDRPDLPVEFAFSGAEASNPGISTAAALQQILRSLWTNRFEEIQIEGLELEIDVDREQHRYHVEAILHDRGPLRPGQALNVRCILGRYRGENVTRELTLQVPEHLTRRSSLRLAVGPPHEIERALGRPITRRLQTAGELDALIRGMGELRSPHRLVAVLYHESRGVVTEGESLDSLPPTAERLLSSRGNASRGGTNRVSALVSSEIELDGPVSGLSVVRLEVDSRLDTEETRR